MRALSRAHGTAVEHGGEESSDQGAPRAGYDETMAPALEVSDLEKSYEAVRAIAGVTLSVAEGEILGLVGPNGAGKTTTLRCLAGILRPSRGSVRIYGKDIATDPVGAKKLLAFLPDEPRLFEYLTVREHLNFVARLYNVTGWEAKADALLAELDLLEKRDVLPGELSRGMKQKLTIACGFLHDPRLVVLDEPLTGLDPVAIRKMKQSIKRRAEQGSAIVLSSHLLPLVEELCDRVCVIARGKVRAIGSIEEIRAKLVGIGTSGDEVSLEDLFIRITEEADSVPSQRAG
jgi:ABC-2 type transport system ATP-binding protein